MTKGSWRDIPLQAHHNRGVDTSRHATRAIFEAGGHVSVARLLDAWYVVCRSAQLRDKPLKCAVHAIPLVVFRDERGQAHALLDRCAHRNVPLSLGRVAGGSLQCAYHGWRFDGQGRCVAVPSMCKEPNFKKRLVPRYATVEQDGYIWVYMTPDVDPGTLPYAMPKRGQPGYTTVQHDVEAKGTLHATIENALDVPHTAFLHRGLFRSDEGTRNRIRAVVTRERDRVQTEYIGEPRPEGLVGRILSPSGGVVTHFDRFILPSIAEVEYGLGTETHIIVSAACTPLDDFHTRLHATVSFRLRIIPGWLIRLLLMPLALRIFGQDAAMLVEQSRAIQRFGGEHYTSTELDLMGPQVWRLLKRAAEGRLGEDDAPPWRREIELDA